VEAERLSRCTVPGTPALTWHCRCPESLRFSPSIEVSVLSHIVARDIRTTTGSNLSLIREVTGLDPWYCKSGQVRKALGEKQAEVPALGKLLAQRGEWHYELRDTSELTELIDSLCVN
jgi:hypothetical protein